METQDNFVSDRSSASDIWGLIQNLLLVIVVVVGLLLISYFISRLLPKKFEFADNLDLGKKNISGDLILNSTQSVDSTSVSTVVTSSTNPLPISTQSSTDNTKQTGFGLQTITNLIGKVTGTDKTPEVPRVVPTVMVPSLTSIPPSTPMTPMTPVMGPTAPVVRVSDPVQAPVYIPPKSVDSSRDVKSLPVHDITGDCYVPVSTYKKYQKITNPSSIGDPAGYIGRDYVCYRNKVGDIDFVKKRFGCMACQVDNDNTKKHNYDGTGTNVISTCVYADKADLEHGIWDEKMCKEQCEKLKDSN